MILNPKKDRTWYIVLLAIICYGILHFLIGYPVSREFMFHAADAQEYYNVGLWIFSEGTSSGTAVRPYLYPLMIVTLDHLFGLAGIWMMQVIAWIVSVTVVILTVEKVTGSRGWASGAGILLISNLSFYALTYTALTEVLTICILSITCYHVVIRSSHWHAIGFHAWNVLLLSILALLKPVFLPVLLIYLLVAGSILLGAAQLVRWRSLTLLFALLPLLPQFVIMKKEHDHIGISQIGPHTFKNYLFARGYAEINELDIDAARRSVAEMKMPGMISYVRENITEYVSLYFTILEDNVYYAGDYTMNMVPGYERPTAGHWIDRFNKFYCILHFGMLIPFVILSYRMFRSNRYPELFALLFLFLLSLFLIITSGISFWQGDRLILPAIACWSILYPIVLFHIISRRSFPLEIDHSGLRT